MSRTLHPLKYLRSSGQQALLRKASACRPYETWALKRRGHVGQPASTFQKEAGDRTVCSPLVAFECDASERDKCISPVDVAEE